MMSIQDDIQRVLDEKREEERRLREELQRSLDEKRIEEELADDRMGHTANVAAGITRAVPGIFEETFDLLASTDEWLGKNLGVIDINPFDGDGIGFDKFEEGVHQSPFRAPEEGMRLIKDAIPEPDRWSGEFMETGGRLVGGMVGAGKFKWIAKLRQSGGWGLAGAAAIQGAIADMVVFDGNDERVANLAVALGVENEFVDWLAADEDDEELEGRMKNVIEGLGLGVAAEGVFRVLKAAKLGTRIKQGAQTVRTRVKEAKDLRSRLAENAKKDVSDEVMDEIPTDPAAHGFVDETGEAAAKQADDITGDIVAREYDPALSRWEVVKDDEGVTAVLPKDATADGRLDFIEDDESISVIWSGIEQAARGEGIGLDGYITLVEYALSQGKVFVSDKSLSRFSRNIYKKLEDAGYPVERNQNLGEIRHVKGAMQTTTDGNPMFRITGRPVSAVDPKPVGKAATRRVTASSSMEDIVGAIKRSVDNGLGKVDIDFGSFVEKPEQLVRLVRALETGYNDVLKSLDPQSNAETLLKARQRLTERFGDDVVQDLYRGLADEDGQAARQVGADQIVIQSEEKLIELARRAASENAKPSEVANFLRQLQAHRALDAHIRGARAETARALQAMAVLKPKRLLEGMSYDDMIREAGVRKNPQAIAELVLKNSKDPKALQEATRRGFWSKTTDVLLEVFYGNILSAPSTTLANIAGNVWKVTEDAILRTVSAPIGTVRELATGRGVGAEGWYRLAGYGSGVMHSFGEMFRFSAASARSFKSFKWTKATKQERIDFYQGQEELGRVWKAILTGQGQTGRTSKLAEAGLNRRQIEYSLPREYDDMSAWGKATQRVLQGVVNTVGGAVRLPGKSIVTIDEVFKTFAEQTDQYARAYGDGYVNLKAGGLPDHIKTVGDYVTDAVGDQRYANDAVEHAARQTFQQRGGNIQKFLQEAQSKFPLLRFAIPFVRTPANIAKDAWSYTPLRLLNKAPYEALSKGGPEADKVIAKLGMASFVNYQVYQLWADGKIRGSNAESGNSKQLEGVSKYSIQDGEGTWHQFNRLDPIGMMMGVAVDVLEGFSNAKSSEEQERWWQFGNAVAMAFGQNMLSKTWLQGVSEVVEVVSQFQRGYGMSGITAQGGLLSNLIPIAGSNFERRRAAGQDDFARYMLTTLDEMRSRIPEEGPSVGKVIAGGVKALTGFDLGDRGDLGIRRDALGRPVYEQTTMSNISRESQETDRELNRLLADFNFDIPTGGRSIGGVKLDSKQRSEFLLLRGQVVKDMGMTLEKRLLRTMGDPLFQRYPIESQRAELINVVNRYSRLARDELVRRDPVLAEQVKTMQVVATQPLGNLRERVANASQQENPVLDSLLEPEPLERLAQDEVEESLKAIGVTSGGQ